MSICANLYWSGSLACDNCNTPEVKLADLCPSYNRLTARTSFGRRGSAVVTQAAKQLHFNKNGEAMKRMQAGVDKLATVVGITLGPKVRLW